MCFARRKGEDTVLPRVSEAPRGAEGEFSASDASDRVPPTAEGSELFLYARSIAQMHGVTKGHERFVRGIAK